jgi:two-component system, NarL family, nitrate/nitrite response regulator NarL
MPNPLKKIQLIIADDSPEFLEGLTILISTSRKYFIFKTYKNGKQLVQSRYLNKANIILIDIEMPGINGLEAAKIIRNKCPDLPLVALSMHIEDIYIEEILQSGFKAFVHKPQTSLILFNILDKVIENKYTSPPPPKDYPD